MNARASTWAGLRFGVSCAGAQQSAAKAPAQAPGAPAADAPGGHADSSWTAAITVGWAQDGPQFTILFAVDDATGCVVNALFCDHEDTSSYFLLMQGSAPALRHTPRPCTPTVTRSSSTSRNISPPARPPSLDGQWQSWGYN